MYLEYTLFIKYLIMTKIGIHVLVSHIVVSSTPHHERGSNSQL
jgi:hypothetical protein